MILRWSVPILLVLAILLVSGCSNEPATPTPGAASNAGANSSQPAPSGGSQSAPANAVLKIDVPASPVEIGQTGVVVVRTENATNLWGISLKLSLDPAIVECVSGQAGTLPKPEVQAKNACSASGLDYIVTQKAPTEAANGSGDTVQVTVRCRAAGTSPLRLENLKLVDRDGIPLPATVTEGQIVCK